VAHVPNGGHDVLPRHSVLQGQPRAPGQHCARAGGGSGTGVGAQQGGRRAGQGARACQTLTAAPAVRRQTVETHAYGGGSAQAGLKNPGACSKGGEHANLVHIEEGWGYMGQGHQLPPGQRAACIWRPAPKVHGSEEPPQQHSTEGGETLGYTA